MAITNPGATQLAAASTLARQPFSTQFAQQITVDLNPAPTPARIVREGYQVPSVALNLTKSAFFLDDLRQIPVRDEPRVVSQSVPAGSKVMPGTTVDLVMAPTAEIPFDIFELPHRNLIGVHLNTIMDGILQNAAVRQTLLKYDNPADVPPAEKAVLLSNFAVAKVQVDDAHADTSFAAAFNSMRGALAFR
jgi:hypothetical protein